ncbi:hypothetical protein BGX24_011520 [Mortierella sp. AD032]|nr:hypothetical protein BGX24_011520 [Mortierella sp. AD032]
MNTARPSSRSSNISSVSSSHAGPPRRAKIAAMAQMDISSIPLTKPARLAPSSSQQNLTMQQQQMQQQPPRPRPAVKMRSSGSVTTMSSLSSSNNRNTNSSSSSVVTTSSRDMMTAQTTAPIVRNSKGGNVNGGSVVGGGGSSTVGVVRRIGTGSNNNLSVSAGPTATAATGGFVVSVGKGTTGTGTGGVGARRISARREGSVTSSDDGTVSEDSVEDPIQLFSGGGGLHINGLPFAHPSLSSRSSSGPKMTSSSSVVSAAGSGVGVRTRGPSSTVSTTAKPMRIAAGAAIKVNTNSYTAASLSTNIGGASTTGSVSSITIPSLSVISASSSGQSLSGMATSNGGGVLSTSLSSSTSSSSLSWVSSPSQRNSGGYEPRSPSPTFSTPALSSQLQQQQQQQSFPPPPTSPNGPSLQNISRTATIKAPASGAASVAAASKLAEENRRQEEAARTRRKIADLEISNTSLLQINQTLEAAIRKQAAEMQELKTRMQSAQFGGDLSWMASSQDQDSSLIGTMNATTTPEAAVMIHELTEAERQADMTFKRLCLTIDQMLFEAKQALDQSSKPAGVKVLSSFDMYEKEALEEEELDAADQSIVIDEDDIDAIGGGGHAQTEEQGSTPATMITTASNSTIAAA